MQWQFIHSDSSIVLQGAQHHQLNTDLCFFSCWGKKRAFLPACKVFFKLAVPSWIMDGELCCPGKQDACCVVWCVHPRLLPHLWALTVAPWVLICILNVHLVRSGLRAEGMGSSSPLYKVSFLQKTSQHITCEHTSPTTARLFADVHSAWP